MATATPQIITNKQDLLEYNPNELLWICLHIGNVHVPLMVHENDISHILNAILNYTGHSAVRIFAIAPTYPENYQRTGTVNCKNVVLRPGGKEKILKGKPPRFSLIMRMDLDAHFSCQGSYLIRGRHKYLATLFIQEHTRVSIAHYKQKRSKQTDTAPHKNLIPQKQYTTMQQAQRVFIN